MWSRVSWCLALLTVVNAFYLPGLAPTKFCTEEEAEALGDKDCKVTSWFYLMPSYYISLQTEVFVHVNKLDSVVQILPYEYSR